MKILWICNAPTSDAAEYLNLPKPLSGGWLTGLSESIRTEEGVELTYCFPSLSNKAQKSFYINNIQYYTFYSSRKFPFINIDGDRYEKRKQLHIRKILEDEKPDIVHVFGTEFVHSLIAIRECEGKYKAVCSVQGLTSIIASHYSDLIEDDIKYKMSFSCILRGRIVDQQNKMAKRGKNEIQLLKECKCIIGRTKWDRACTYFFNNDRQYYLCNETLRKSFYGSAWTYSKCKKHSIFVSQASSPIKGFNVLLEAISLLKDEYPEIQINVAGKNFIKKDTIMSKIAISTYGQYIAELINKKGLNETIHFLGPLSEERMRDEYLSANIFVSASSIENSSNSIGEAMLLGMPVISSNVGGVASLLQDGKEGLLYPANSKYMLAYQIKTLFDNPNIAIELGNGARKRAIITHSPEKNKEQLLKIYSTITNIGR